MATSHDFWTDRLSDYLDGLLEAQEREAVAEHLSQCAGCRSVEAELSEVKRRARALGGIAPPADLFDRIRARMDESTDVVDLTLRLDPAPVYRAATPRPRRAWSGEIRAAAAIAALVATGATGWAFGAGQGAAASSEGASAGATPAPTAISQVSTTEGGDAEADLARSVSDLERLLSAAPEDLDPNTVRILRKNLALIQAAIAESQDALRQDPDNAYVRRHLEGAMERQRAFVQQASQLLEADD